MYTSRRARKPPLPPPHATGPALFFSVVMTDWLFACTGAVSQSMDMVMGSGVKVRTVLGASVDSFFRLSFVVVILWGGIMSVFVLRTHHKSFNAASAQLRRFPVRTSWLVAWSIGLSYGLVATARLQAHVKNTGSQDVLDACLRYFLAVVYALSGCSVVAANVLLFTQRRAAARAAATAATATAMTTASSLASTGSIPMTSTKTRELQAQQALRAAHERLERYLLLVSVLQLPIVLTFCCGTDVLSYTFFEVAECILFSVPLLNAIMFGWRRIGETRGNFDAAAPDNRTALHSSSRSSRPADPHHRDRLGTGLATSGIGGGVGNVLASSYRTLFASSAHSNAGGREKEPFQATYVGQERVALEELDGLSHVSFLAEGAAGSVYKAQWLGIDVAMKVIKLPNAGTAGVVDADLYRTIIQHSEEAFIEEAALCSRLRHPNITLFMRAGYYEGKLGILTEYCARGSLKDVLKRNFPLNWRRKVALALHISKGLTYLHARNPTYIHRDLKASNILVTETWQAKLADFGISKVANLVNRVRYSGVNLADPMQQNTSISDELTSFAGTWRWNAPEILQDPHNCRYSRATDMYSFGMVLWEIASDGAVPFSDTKFDFEVREKVLVEQRPPINPGQRCPPRFAELLAQCWAQNASHRPSAPQAAETLSAILDGMAKDSHEFATAASVTASEYTNSIFSSLRGDDGASDLEHRPSSMLGARLTNLFRGRFSVARSSGGKSEQQQQDRTDSEQFYKFTSPYAGTDSIGTLSGRGSSAVALSPANLEASGFGPILGLPHNSSRRGDRQFGRLSSLDEYDFEMDEAGTPSDVSTTYSGSPSDGRASMLPPFREITTDGMLEERGSDDEDEFVLGADGRPRHLQATQHA
ncbi:hypothetical protein BBJ28_00011835 [Nothophytophthora sp. Chile5]|nr:hypothetical protein BBJ28_00011835 [Nothophytophthora sp. Chile5]